MIVLVGYCLNSILKLYFSKIHQISSSMSSYGKSPIYKALGLTKVAYLSGASKYLTPFTTPLLFPNG
jgi:hypothetical protein